MVIHFESFGNFTTETNSHRALTSKKSRGTIELNDKSFVFKSEKDKIVYDIKISSIQNFYFVNRFRLRYIELISDQGLYYNFYAREDIEQSYSKKLTEELFRSLTRVIYKKNYPILFETKVCFIKRKVEKSIYQIKLHNGILLLTEESLIFKAYKKKPNKEINILDLEKIEFHSEDSDYYIQLQQKEGSSFSIVTYKTKSKRNRKDKGKTMKLYELLIQVKEYKLSEKLKQKEEEEQRITQLKSMFEVSNKVRLEMVRIALNMDEKTFDTKIFDWAKKFKFIIDGDYLIVNRDTIAEFIDNLKIGFDLSVRRDLKIKCINCGKLIDYTARICPYCGKEQYSD